MVYPPDSSENLKSTALPAAAKIPSDQAETMQPLPVARLYRRADLSALQFQPPMISNLSASSARRAPSMPSRSALMSVIG